MVDVVQVLGVALFACCSPRWWGAVQLVGHCFLFGIDGGIGLFVLCLGLLDLVFLFVLSTSEVEHLLPPLEVPQDLSLAVVDSRWR